MLVRLQIKLDIISAKEDSGKLKNNISLWPLKQT